MKLFTMAAATLLSLSAAALDAPVAPIQSKTLRLHGDTRVDNYFWLREKDKPETLAYLQAENAYAEALTRTSKPLEERLALFRRFLPEWGRRHEIAVAEREPRLVHENGDGKHVMILPDALLWFDFEMIWRSRSAVRMHVAHEIIQYLWFLTRNTAPDIRDQTRV